MGIWDWRSHFSVVCPPRIYWEYDFVTSTVIWSILLAAGLGLLLLYPLAFSLSKAFRCLPPEEDHHQLNTTLHHHVVVEFVVLTLLFAPFTYCILYMNFILLDSLDETMPIYTIFEIIMVTIVLMYMIKIASPWFRSPRPLLLAHHVVAIGNSVYLMAALTTINAKAACSIIIFCATLEAPLFLSMILYRHNPDRPRLTKRIMVFATILFGVTRPLQLVWVLVSLVAIWDKPNFEARNASIQICICVLFTCLQLYTLLIYRSLLRKLNERILDFNKEMDATESALFVDETSVSFNQQTQQICQQAQTIPECDDITEISV